MKGVPPPSPFRLANRSAARRSSTPPRATNNQGKFFLCFCFLYFLLLCLLAIKPPYFWYSNWNEYTCAIRSQICCSVKIDPHIGMPVPIPPRRILPCNNAGLAPSILVGSVKSAGVCIIVVSAPFIVCLDDSPAAARSSAKTPLPAP